MLVLRQSIRQTLQQRLTAAQRLQISSVVLALRLELVDALRGERYEPQGQCPKCSHKMEPAQVIQGFNRDVNDFTTCCPKCRHRFTPMLVCFAATGIRLELPFFCDSQTLNQMHGKEHLTPEQFSREHPAIYRAAIVHHGGLQQAFAKIGIKYPFEPVHDWKSKVRPFLGRLPDTRIAEAVHEPVRVIRAMRKELGIERFLVHKLLDEESGDDE